MALWREAKVLAAAANEEMPEVRAYVYECACFYYIAALLFELYSYLRLPPLSDGVYSSSCMHLSFACVRSGGLRVRPSRRERDGRLHSEPGQSGASIRVKVFLK